MHEIELLIALFTAFLVVMAVARRLAVPFPVTLVASGILLSLVPGLPAFELPPEVVLLIFLPPLLYAEACATSWRDFKANLRPIGLLSIGLVIATTLTVAVTAHWLLPELPWAACFILGAVVAPTDAVAALAIAHRLPLPRRLVTILVGESLVNDATALVAYRIAIAAVLTGSFSAGEALLRFVGVGLGGVVLGLAVGWGVHRLFRLLGRDALMVNAVSLLVPFLAYLPAELLGVSGVLAVVTCGLYVGRQAAAALSFSARVAGYAVWEMVDFLLNGLLFLLVGLQLRTILHAPSSHGTVVLVGFGVVIALVVIVTRIAWVFPATYLPRWLSPRLAARDPLPPAKNVVVLAWSGMRGGISLAAALAVPTALASGAPFPGRGEIIFLTFMVILCTLVFQGLTLPMMIRRLDVRADGSEAREANEARLVAARAGLARLEAMVEAEGIAPEVYEPFRRHYEEEIKLRCEDCGIVPDPAFSERVALQDRIWREALEAERQAVVQLRDEGVIGDDVLNELLAEFDLEAVWLGSASRDASHP